MSTCRHPHQQCTDDVSSLRIIAIILTIQAGYALAATAPFWEQDMSNVESVMDVNLNGLMNVTRECAGLISPLGLA